MYHRRLSSMLVTVALVTGLLAIASPALACSADPTAAPNADVSNLEDDAAHWGMYCGNTVDWTVSNTTDPATQAMLLDLSILGGEPYAYAHAYRHLLPDLEANDFRLRTSFNYQPADGGPATAVHALQFGMESWANGMRYEMALEWVNRGDDTSQWRLWNGSRWVDTGISQDLAPSAWHTLELKATITSDGNVRYTSFNIDGVNHKLAIEVPAVATPGEIDRLAVTTSVVGNFQTDPFDVFLDNVSLERSVKSAAKTDGPGAGAELAQARQTIEKAAKAVTKGKK